MPASPTLLSEIAAVFYMLVVLACVAAAVTAGRRRQIAWHGRIWLALALLLIAFAALRLLDFEDLFRDNVRALFRASGAYAQRRTVQGPIAIVALAMVAVGAILIVPRLKRLVRGRRDSTVLGAACAASAMTVLLGLRLLSYHPVDALLYGPLKLHWIIDLGSAAAIMGFAFYYIKLVRQKT